MHNKANDIECIWDTKSVLGEGVVWHAGEQALYWVDIHSSTLYRYIPQNSSKQSWHLPPSISSVVPCASGGLVGTFADGIKLIDTGDGSVKHLLDPEPEAPGNRLNDGACDMQGNFWFGSMDNSEQTPSGAFYRLNSNLECQKVVEGIVITNGPAFTPNGAIIYLTDTLQQVIYQAKLNADGSIGNKQIFVQLKDEGFPDGMAVDAEGYLWCALFTGGKVMRFDPDGQLERVIPMPAPNITKCCFGGADLQTLYITTATKTMSAEQLGEFPLAGGLFAIEQDVKGVASPSFVLQKQLA